MALIKGATPSTIQVLVSGQIPHTEFNPMTWITQLYMEHNAEPWEVVVEDFLGAGPRSPESSRTLKIIGAVEYLCDAYRIDCVVVPSQHRLNALTQAKTMCAGTHAGDALAHALSRAYNHHKIARPS